jgi:SAM-dependent methyltransferase
VDRVLVVNTYHHISDRIAYFKRLRDSLKPNGEVAIIDFTAESPIGPPKSQRISPRKVAEEMTLAGYVQVAQHTFLTNQYFLVFQSGP